MISVIIPTIGARWEWLKRCLDAYSVTSDPGRVPPRVVFVVVTDQPTCGLAWNEGAERALRSPDVEYLHFSADDLEPAPGWWQAAVECVDSGAIPSPRILNSDGSLQSSGQWGVDLPAGTVTDIARIPFMSREQWELIGPSLPIHYFTDNWVAVRAARAGIPTVVCPGYEFTHHFAPEGRLDGPDGRMTADHEAFQRACAA